MNVYNAKKRFKHKRCGSIGDHKIWWKSHKTEHFVIKRNTSVIKRNTFLESGLSNWSTETLLKNQGKKFWGAKWSARTGNEDELKEKKCGCFLRGETSRSITVIFWVSQKVEKCQFYFTHFSMKTASKKKWSTPWRSHRKILWNCHLRFFNFKTLSQRFFATKFLRIQNVENIANHKNMG